VRIQLEEALKKIKEMEAQQISMTAGSSEPERVLRRAKPLSVPSSTGEALVQKNMFLQCIFVKKKNRFGTMQAAEVPQDAQSEYRNDEKFASPARTVPEETIDGAMLSEEDQQEIADAPQPEVPEKPHADVSMAMATAEHHQVSVPPMAPSEAAVAPRDPDQDAVMVPSEAPAAVADATAAVPAVPDVPMAEPASAAGPPDRSLQLAGLQALMQQQKQREAAQQVRSVQHAQETLRTPGALEALHVTAPKVEVNWVTHKKEGMRLKRLMEESPDAQKFPHMVEMWSGSMAESWNGIDAELFYFFFAAVFFGQNKDALKMLYNCAFGSLAKTKDRKRLLQQWVASNGNADTIEADLVLSKTQSKKHQGTRELLTTQEMLKRDIPIEKVRAIVARGNGVPDSDCPDIPSLTRFWVSTGVKQVDTDEYKQEARVRVQADASAGLDTVFGSLGGAATSSIGADRVQALLGGLSSDSTTALAGLSFFVG